MSIEDEIARFDWFRIRTYVGHADMVPNAVRGLVAATEEKEAARFGERLGHILLSVAGPCEACAPVATLLVATLTEMTPAGHRVALDLLSLIAAAQSTGHEQIGAVDVKEIRQAVAGGFQHYAAVLRSESSSDAELYSCIDLIDILAFHDPSLAAEAIAVLKAIRTDGRAPGITVSIDNTLDDLTGASSDPS